MATSVRPRLGHSRPFRFINGEMVQALSKGRSAGFANLKVKPKLERSNYIAVPRTASLTA